MLTFDMPIVKMTPQYAAVPCSVVHHRPRTHLHDHIALHDVIHSRERGKWCHTEHCPVLVVHGARRVVLLRCPHMLVARVISRG